MPHSFVAYVQVIATAQFFLLAAFLGLRWRSERKNWAIGLLFCFVGTKALAMLDYALGSVFRRATRETEPFLQVLFSPALYLYMPFFYLYARASCEGDFRWRKRDAWHFAPFLAYSLLIGWKWFDAGVAGFNQLVLRRNLMGEVERFVFSDLRQWVVVGYLVAASFVIWKYHRRLKDRFADARVQQLRWLVFLVASFATISVWAIFRSSISQFFDAGRTFWIVSQVGYTVILFLFANALVFKSLEHRPYDLHKELEVEKPEAPASDEDLQKLRTAMEVEKAFLDQELSLERLAEISGLPQRRISRLIREVFEENFFRYVNRYRVEEAKRLLREDASKTITEVLYASGFNSKSTFNDAFKQAVGKTPSQYRAAYREDLSNISLVS